MNLQTADKQTADKQISEFVDSIEKYIPDEDKIFWMNIAGNFDEIVTISIITNEHILNNTLSPYANKLVVNHKGVINIPNTLNN